MSVTQPASTRPRRPGGRRLLVLAPIALVGVGTLVGARARVSDNVLAPGIHVGTLELGGKTPEQARTALASWAAEEQHAPIRLHFTADTGRERTWKTDAEHLGLGVDVPATLDAVVKTGRDSMIGQVSRLISGTTPTAVPPHVTIDGHQERAYLRQLAHTVDRKPKDAHLVFIKGGGFGSRHDRPGFALDVDASAAAVTQAWQRLNSAPSTPAASGNAAPSGASPSTNTAPDRPASPPSTGGASPPPPTSSNATAAPADAQTGADVALIGKITKAAITFDDLKQIDGQISGFATSYATGDRGDNIHLAASHINGTLLMPGQVFSYNRIVGPRDESTGFKQAPVIIHGQLKPGIGGGICQVSSTLYNAVLLAGLKVVQRSHHAFKVHYLPAGRDATVVDGEIDFQFQNNTPAPIYIVGSGHGGYLHFAIFGKKTPGRTVTMVQGKRTVGDVPEEIDYDPTLRAGRRRLIELGHPDVRVTWYRVIRQDGRLVSKEAIRTHYSAFPAKIALGTKQVAPRIPRAPRAVKPAPGFKPPVSTTPNPAAPPAAPANKP